MKSVRMKKWFSMSEGLLQKYKDLSTDHQNTHKKPDMLSETCNSSDKTGEALAGHLCSNETWRSRLRERHSLKIMGKE